MTFVDAGNEFFTLSEGGSGVTYKNTEISILWLSEKSVSLNVGSQVLDDLKVGGIGSVKDAGFDIALKEINWNSKDVGISKVSIEVGEDLWGETKWECEKCSTLFEGETINYAGTNISIESISESEVSLKVNDVISDKFGKGDLISMKDVGFDIRIKAIDLGKKSKVLLEFEFGNEKNEDVEKEKNETYYKDGGELPENRTEKKEEVNCENCWTLEVGKVMDYEGVKIEIIEILDGKVKLSVGGVNTLMTLGKKYSLKDTGFDIRIKEINQHLKDGALDNILLKLENLGENEKEDGVRNEYKIILNTSKENTCGGCLIENRCYPIGYIKSGEFCSENGEFRLQVDETESCENNFECGSNICAAKTCVSEGLIKKILAWFGNLFS